MKKSLNLSESEGFFRTNISEEIFLVNFLNFYAKKIKLSKVLSDDSPDKNMLFPKSFANVSKLKLQIIFSENQSSKRR